MSLATTSNVVRGEHRAGFGVMTSRASVAIGSSCLQRREHGHLPVPDACKPVAALAVGFKSIRIWRFYLLSTERMPRGHTVGAARWKSWVSRSNAFVMFTFRT